MAHAIGYEAHATVTNGGDPPETPSSVFDLIYKHWPPLSPTISVHLKAPRSHTMDCPNSHAQGTERERRLVSIPDAACTHLTYIPVHTDSCQWYSFYEVNFYKIFWLKSSHSPTHPHTRQCTGINYRLRRPRLRPIPSIAYIQQRNMSAMASGGGAGEALAMRQAFQAVLEAVHAGSLPDFKKAARRLKTSELMQLKDGFGRGILHHAAQQGQAAICAHMVEDLKMDVNAQDDSGAWVLT